MHGRQLPDRCSCSRPGWQRWQNEHCTPLSHFPSRSKGHGLHVPELWPFEPILGHCGEPKTGGSTSSSARSEPGVGGVLPENGSGLCCPTEASTSSPDESAVLTSESSFTTPAAPLAATTFLVGVGVVVAGGARPGAGEVVGNFAVESEVGIRPGATKKCSSTSK